MGCYKDDTSSRDLNYKAFGGPEANLQNCLRACASRKDLYTGLQNG